jgi:hypothetical protein
MVSESYISKMNKVRPEKHKRDPGVKHCQKADCYQTHYIPTKYRNKATLVSDRKRQKKHNTKALTSNKAKQGLTKPSK